MKKIQNKDTTLINFMRDECASFSKHYESCIFSDSCKVLDGGQCGYFEHYVLGPSEYRHKLPGYDYPKLYAQYAESISKAV
jgi:hypothetical protein